jgi:hypothetical protein
MRCSIQGISVQEMIPYGTPYHPKSGERASVAAGLAEEES